MANKPKIKRINLNMPIYILDEIDELAEKRDETRTDIIVNGVKKEIEQSKRQEKIERMTSELRKKPILDPKKNKEMFMLGGVEWVKRLREEGEE